MKVSHIDAHHCPLCGDNNQCGIAAGDKSCWCFSQPVPQGVLQKLPAEARGVACVCRVCAMSQNALERALGRMAKCCGSVEDLRSSHLRS